MGLALVSAAPAEAAGRPATWYGLPTSMSLSAPQAYDAVPVTFTVTLSNTQVTGSVSFWANGPEYGLAPSVRVINGQASLTWTPGYTGPNNWITFGADFTPDPQQGTTSASATVPPTIVLANKGADIVTVAPAAASVRQGVPLAVATTTASGATPSYSVTGPCTLTTSPSVSITGTSPGTCTISASTWGGGAYLSGSGSTSVTITAPAKPKPHKPKPKPHR